MKFGDLATGVITHFDHKGRGVFDVPLQNGKMRPFLVPFTTIGDEVEVSFLKRKQGCFVGQLVRVIKPGPSRISDEKQHPGTLWNHINYDDQLAFKRDMINRVLEEAGRDERITEVIPCPPTNPHSRTPAIPQSRNYYRNKMDYVFGWQGELGLKEYGTWNRYIDLKDCPLLSHDVPKILQVFRDFMKQFPELKPWDAKKHVGDLRYVVIREGKNTGDRIIALVVKDLSRITDDARNYLKDKLDSFANNIALSENTTITDVSFGDTIITLKGKETIDEIINDTQYTIHLNSFFQTNSMMAAKLQDVVAEMASGIWHLASGQKPNVKCQMLDLYCGLGFFAINLAKRYPTIKTVGYELDEEMIELAKHNAKQNNVADRTEFASGKAEALDWKDIEADTIIVDPPRSGLHPKVIRTLLEKEPQTIVYVSCNYHRLVNELNELKKKYQVKDLKALDLFPNTPHVEVVVKLDLI
jgi:23S rRNA (uracil-5-)-methyltransferase RumA